MRIIDSSNKRAIHRLVDRQQTSDAAIERQVARIVDAVRRRGDAALREYARRFDRLEGPLEVSRHDLEQGAREAPPAVRRAIKVSARNIRRIAARQLPQTWRLSVVPGVVVEQRVTPHRPCRLLCPRWTVSLAVVAPHGGNSGTRRWCARGDSGLPTTCTSRNGRGA